MEINLEKKNEVKAKGLHIISICTPKKRKSLFDFFQYRLENVRLKRAEAIKLKQWSLLKPLHEEFIFYRERFLQAFKAREYVIENITTTVGRSVSAQRLGGDNTYTGNVTHTALGTGVAAAVIGDTTLGTEVYRKALSSGTDSNNISYIETFFTATEDSGTYEEFGNFIDGTGAADSGQLFNRFLDTVVKSNVETLNVQSQVTWSDA